MRQAGYLFCMSATFLESVCRFRAGRLCHGQGYASGKASGAKGQNPGRHRHERSTNAESVNIGHVVRLKHSAAKRVNLGLAARRQLGESIDNGDKTQRS